MFFIIFNITLYLCHSLYQCLQHTRIGRNINDVRKKTKDKALAKRIKSLVKRWQQLVPSTPQDGIGGAAQKNGEVQSTIPVSPPTTRIISSANQLASPKLATAASSPSLSTLPSEGKRKRNFDPHSIDGRHSKKSKAKSPPKYIPSDNGGHTVIEDKDISSLKINSPINRNLVSPRLKHERMSSPSIRSKIVHSPLIRSPHIASPSSNTNSPYSKRVITPDSLKSINSPYKSTLSPNSVKFNNDDTKIDDEQMSWASSSIDASSRSCSPIISPKEVAPKVHNTAQLIKSMHDGGYMNLTRSETIPRIANNDIEREDDTPLPVVPANAMPRPRRKNQSSLPPVSEESLSKCKSDHLQKFLNTSLSPSKCDISVDDEKDLPDPICDSSSNSPIEMVHIENRLENLSNTEAFDNHMKELRSRLPPIDYSWMDDYEEPVVKERLPPTPEDLHRVQHTEWDGVNGNIGHDGEFKCWSEMVTLSSGGDRLIHILPYVDIEYSSDSTQDDND